MPTIREEVRKEAKRIEEDSLYSAKGHFNDAGVWNCWYYALGIPSAVLAAFASVSAFAKLDASGIVAGITSFIVVALTSITTLLKPNEKACQHKEAGGKYLSLRNRARILAELELRIEHSDEELINMLKELSNERDKLNQESPEISNRSYQKAKKGVEEGQSSYEVDRKNARS